MSRNVTVSEWAGNLKGLARLANSIIAISRIVPGSGVGGWKCLFDKFNAIERVRLEDNRRSGGVRLALLNQTLKLVDSQPKIAVTLRARNLHALGHRAVIVHIIQLEPCDEIQHVLIRTALPATGEDHRADVDVQLAKFIVCSLPILLRKYLVNFVILLDSRTDTTGMSCLLYTSPSPRD